MGQNTDGAAARGAIKGIIAVVILLGLVAVGCGGNANNSSPNDTQAKAGNAGVVEKTEPAELGGKIVYGLIAETNGWNPSASQWAPSGQEVARAMFDTLSAYDKDSKIQPYLAQSFVPAPDYMSWTINLRPGITLTNGKPVNAALVAANQTYLQNAVLTRSAYMPLVADNAFTTDGDLKVIVHMKEPWVNYPYAMATQIGVVVDQDWLSGKGDQAHPIGSGPFAMDHWIPEKELVVKKNPNYWQKDTNNVQLPYLDEVDFVTITDDNSRSASMQKGDLNIMEATNADDIIRFKDMGDKGEYQVFNATSGETSETFIQLNGMAPPFNDIDARKALAYATDKQDFIDTAEHGLYQPANGPFPPNSYWYNKEVETTYPQYDAAKAKELVDKVKAKNGGTFAFKLIGPPTTQAATALQYLQQAWKEVGIDVTIETVEQAPLIVQVLTGGYQAVSWQQFASPHPLGDSIWWHPNTANPIPEYSLNFARNKDQAIGDALDDARRTTDPAQELKDYQFVQKQIDVDVPYIWLYHSQISIVAANNIVNVVNYTLPPNEKGERIKGLEIQDGSHPLWQVWIKH